ncbi:sulfotransferase [Pseudomonadota bacterium]
MSEFWRKVDKTLRYHGRQATITLRGMWWDAHPVKASRPIFIVGCSRAGTTLVYKTLSESREVGTLQRETHDFWSDLHPLQTRQWKTHALAVSDASDQDRDYVTRYFYAWTGKLRFVDKNNQHGLCVPYLHSLFPDACFIYVKRSPGDNLNSLIEGWGKPEEFATWSSDLPAAVAIDGGRYNQWCFFLADGWQDFTTSSIEEVCAFQYSAMNRAILDARDLVPKEQWAEVFYEDIVRDPVSSFEGIFHSCGLGFDAHLRHHTQDVLHTPYNAFSEIRLDKWKTGRNREKIERILPSVKETAALMGYSN